MTEEATSPTTLLLGPAAPTDLAIAGLLGCLTGGNACSFSADTEVATDGDTTPISEIEVGDKVLAYNEQTQVSGYYAVTAVWSHEDPLVVRLRIEGEVVETTPEHPFYVVDRGWTAADDLRVGSRVRDAGGTYDVVEAVAVVRSSQVMYNLTVAEAHTYFVGDGQWLVHNDCNLSLLDTLRKMDARTFRGALNSLQGEAAREGHAIRNAAESLSEKRRRAC
jgi:hypothetical protein